MNNKPRLPSNKEQDDIAIALAERQGCSLEGFEFDELKEVVNASYIAIFDEYITGCPGYVGKVALFVSDGAPSMFECFTWNEEGKAVIQQQEYCRGCEELNKRLEHQDNAQ